MTVEFTRRPLRRSPKDLAGPLFAFSDVLADDSDMMIFPLAGYGFEMSDEEDCGAWVAFSEVGINARMRNALELFDARNSTATGSAGSAVAGQWPSSTPVAGSSVDLKLLPAAPIEGGFKNAAGLTAEDANTRAGDELRKLG